MHRGRYLTLLIASFFLFSWSPNAFSQAQLPVFARPGVGAPAPALHLPALNPLVIRQLVETEDLNLDHLCGTHPRVAARLCLVLWMRGSAEEQLQTLKRAQQLHRRYGKQKVRVIVISATPSNEPIFTDTAQQAPFPVLADPYAVAASAWGITSFPSFFFLNPDGTIRLEGTFDLTNELPFVHDFLQQALAHPQKTENN